MGYKCLFMDNEVYTAQDVDNVFSYLTSEGVSVFSDGGDNPLSDLNSAVSDIVSEGVDLTDNSCRVIAEDGIYKISPGVCFMNDGSSIKFDSEGYQLQLTTGSESYVFLKRRQETNSIDICVSQNVGEGDFVPLARIDADGNIHDMRIFSTVKVTPASACITKPCTVSLWASDSEHEPTITSVDTQFSAFKYIIIKRATFNPDTILESVFTNFADNGIIPDSEDFSEIRCVVGSQIAGRRIYVRKNGANVEIYAKVDGRGGMNAIIEFEVI